MDNKDIVKCRDCKYWDKDYYLVNFLKPVKDKGMCSNGKLLKAFHIFPVTPGWFGCIFGERRVEETDSEI